MHPPVPSDAIPTHLFDAGLLPEADQFEAWSRFTSNSRVTRPGQWSFFAQASFWNLNEMLVSPSRRWTR